MKDKMAELKTVVLLLVIVAGLAVLLTFQSMKKPVASHTWLPVYGVLILEEGYIFEATPYIKLQICTKHDGEIRAVMIPVEDVPWPHGIDYEKFKLFMGGTDEQGRGSEEVPGCEDEGSISEDNPE